MTRKNLMNLKEQYKRWALVCSQNDNKYQLIAGTCRQIANEKDYNHRKRGQHLQAFFQALEEVETKTKEADA